MMLHRANMESLPVALFRCIALVCGPRLLLLLLSCRDVRVNGRPCICTADLHAHSCASGSAADSTRGVGQHNTAGVLGNIT
jgi:hypothetical protein